MDEKMKKFLIIYFGIAIIVGIIALISDFINKSTQYENILVYKMEYYGGNTFCEFYKENGKYFFSMDDDYSGKEVTKEISPVAFYLISYRTALMEIEDIDGYDAVSRKNYSADTYGIIITRKDGKRLNAKARGAGFPLGKNVKALEETIAHSVAGDWDVFIVSEIKNIAHKIRNFPAVRYCIYKTKKYVLSFVENITYQIRYKKSVYIYQFLNKLHSNNLNLKTTY